LTHKVQKSLFLENDPGDILNEMLLSVGKVGKIGLIRDLIGHVNGLNIGALMEKGNQGVS